MATVPPLPLAGFSHPTQSVTPPTPTASADTPHKAAINITFKKIKSEGISHHFPILTGLRVPGKEGDNPSMQALVAELREEGQNVTTFPVEWRNTSPEDLAAAFAPMRLHYLTQGLLMIERTRRRVVENEETTAWANMHVAFQYTTPLKYKLLAHWTKNVLEKQLHEMENAQDGMQSSLAGSEVSSYRTSPTARSGESEDEVPLPASRSKRGMPRPGHSHPAAPPILPSRRGSLPTQGSARARAAVSTSTTNVAHKAPRVPRVHTLEEAQGSAASFEKTLTMLIETAQGGAGQGRGRRHAPTADTPPLKPLTIRGVGGGSARRGSGAAALADVFQSAVKTPTNAEKAGE